jgi:Cu-Zn family superoxide dismutase
MIALQGLRVLPVALTISERRNLPELMEWLAGLGNTEKTMKPYVHFLSIACCLTMGIGCASSSNSRSDADASKPSGAKVRPMAVAVLSPAANGSVKGQVTFLEETEGVRVTANIEGLTPGKHGFHIHEKGDCSAADFTSAGGHFNPTNSKHGSPTDPEHHVGDFGNLEANERGVARFERVFQWLTFKGTNSILNKAVIVHEKADDLQTQPTGDAGGRIACGVIQMTN